MDHSTAREIMLSNMLGFSEVEQYLREITDKERDALKHIPFSEETLRTYAGTHVLVADIGLSILGMREIVPSVFFRDRNKRDWYVEESFARYTGTARWLLLQKTPVDNSISKSWQEQQVLVKNQKGKVPDSRQVVYTTVLYYRTLHARLFGTRVRTSCRTDLQGGHVYIMFDHEGLYIGYWDDNLPTGRVAVASLIV